MSGVSDSNNNNIIAYDDAPGGLPLDVWEKITLFLDPASQARLMQVSQVFKELVLDTVRICRKAELSAFKNFIMFKADESCTRYEQEVDAFADNLPENVIGNDLILKYYIEKSDLDDVIDDVIKNDDEIGSLIQLKNKYCNLFHFLKMSKVALYITRYFPDISQEITSPEKKHFISIYKMFHELIEKHSNLHALSKDLTWIQNNPSEDAEEQLANAEKAHQIHENVHKEELFLTINGYLATAFDLLPFSDDHMKIELLYLIIFSLSNNKHPLSEKPAKTIINFIDVIEDETVKFILFEAFFKLPLPQILVQNFYEKSIKIAERNSQENPALSKQIIKLLYKLELSEKQMDHLLDILKIIPTQKGLIRELLDVFQHSPSQQLAKQLLNTLETKQPQESVEALLLAKIVQYFPTQEIKSKLLNMAAKMKVPYPELILKELLKVDLSEEEKNTLLNITNKLGSGIKVSILVHFFKIDPRREVTNDIFDMLESMPSKSILQYAAIKKIAPLTLSQENKNRLLKMIEDVEDVENKTKLLINLYGSEISEKEKTDIFNIINNLHYLDQADLFLLMLSKGQLSYENISFIFETISNKKDELGKTMLLKKLCTAALPFEDLQCVAALAAEMTDPEHRRTIFQALANRKS
ncbi:MAG: F-box protein [Chlamydiota bacterium]